MYDELNLLSFQSSIPSFGDFILPFSSKLYEETKKIKNLEKIFWIKHK